MIDAAVAMAGRRGHGVVNLDFQLVGPPGDCPLPLRDAALWRHLDDEAFARKLALTPDYPELEGELQAAAAEYGLDAFRVECLRPVTAVEPPEELPETPFYEVYGARQVARGFYREVLRYRASRLREDDVEAREPSFGSRIVPIQSGADPVELEAAEPCHLVERLELHERGKIARECRS